MSGSNICDAGRWCASVKTLHNQIEKMGFYDPDNAREAEAQPLSGTIGADIVSLARQIWDEVRQDAEKNAEDCTEECWAELLLALYIAHYERRMLSISDLCDESSMRPSSVIRGITEYSRKGLVKKAHVNDNGRRIFVRLSQAGVKLMSEWLSETMP